METYSEMKERFDKEINDLPIYYAFGQEQMNQLISKLGFNSEEELFKNAIYINGGGVVLNENIGEVLKTFENHRKELKHSLSNDDFFVDAIKTEMINHEYSYTGELEDTLLSVGLTMDDYLNDNRINKLVTQAKKELSKEDLEI